MEINGPKKLVKRAKFVAKLLEIEDFNLEISWAKKGSYCLSIDDKNFIIKIHKFVPKYFIIEHIAHEMVHLKQYRQGRLQDGIVWEGEKFDEPNFMSKDYWLAPRELEARSYEAYVAWCWRHR